MRSLAILLLASVVYVTPSKAQQPLVVMNLAAHPDDEDGMTLTYYRHAKDAVAYSVIYTRGEGGQNEIGAELYADLGAIRTQETERAARKLGTQVFFLNFDDFGFSKFADESFERWGGRDAVTARLVYLIRKLKPDVLFTNHDTVTVGPRRQHGQHQVVGLSAYDAMTLAADPAFHPEHLEEDGVDLWQPKRLFVRHWRQPDEYDVAIPVSDTHTPTGDTHVERAMSALGEHASQGMGMLSRFFQTENTYFSLLKGATDAPLGSADLAANLPPNHTATPDLDYRIQSGRAPALPERVLRPFVRTAIPGEPVALEYDTALLGSEAVRFDFSGSIDTSVTVQGSGELILDISSRAKPTLPKAVRQYYRFSSHPPIRVVAYDAADHIIGGRYLPIEIAPPVALRAAANEWRLTPGENRVPLRLAVNDPKTEAVTLRLTAQHESGQMVTVQERHVLASDVEAMGGYAMAFDLSSDAPMGTYTLDVAATPEQSTLPAKASTVTITGRRFEVEAAPGLNVGVVESYDNTIDQALSALGVQHTMLDSLALATGDLDAFDTIVIDIRAYLVRQDLRTHNDRLLAWVQRGGHLIVNYQKVFEWNDQYPDPFDREQANPGDFAPFPIELGRDRVTYEDAPVTILQPNLPLFTTPNAIDDAAWEGWIQERGLYFPSSYDERYTELFALNDPGEAPLRSSTLLAAYGEGTYLFTALGWYRQLKVYHPGAYALFANMVSFPLVEAAPTDAPAGGSR
ncbi:MAG: PIG-L family deacetylase [Bacteroidota bacterium]